MSVTERVSTEDTPPLAVTGRGAVGLAPTLWICTASQILATFSVLGLATITPAVASSLSIDATLIGYQVSLIYFSGIFASAVAGGLVHRFGAARLNQVALSCAGLGFLGLASGRAPVMAAASLLIGVGYAFNNPCSSHMLNRVTPAALRNRVFSIKQAGVPIGGVAAALTVPPLAAAIGWQAALAISSVPILALGLLFGVLRRRWDDDLVPQAKLLGAVARNQRIVWSRPQLLTLSALGMLYSAIQLSVSAFSVTMLVIEFGWSPLRAGEVAAGLQLCGAAGRIVWGLVADRIGSGFLVLGLIGALTGACCLALLIVSTTAGLLAILCVLGFTAIGWNGVMLAETARLSSKGGGTLTGDVLVYTFIGVVIGPSAFAALYAGIGSFRSVFALFAIPALLGSVLAMAARSDRA